MNRFAFTLCLSLLLVAAVSASDTKLGKPALPSQAAINHNATKTVVEPLLPKLVHVATNDISASGPAYVFMMRIDNWKSFPAETLSVAKLPPNPCKMESVNTRYWIELFRTDGGTSVSCAPVYEKTLQSFSFRDYNGNKPSVFARITDLKTGKFYQSKAVATNVP